MLVEADKKIRVLVVDDSPTIRQLLTKLLDEDPAIEVVGAAEDAYAAREKIKQLNPDVITLDIEMPGMDGLTFLSNLMRLKPMPVVMISSLTTKGAAATMEALALGAIDFIGKPKVDVIHEIRAYAPEIRDKVKYAAMANLATFAPQGGSQIKQVGAAPIPERAPAKVKDSEFIIAIGSSTGGTEAVNSLLMDMPPSCPGIVVSQHIPPVFSQSFADRLNECTHFTVTEAKDGDRILDGHVYIAPGDYHLEVVRRGRGFACKVIQTTPRVNRHRPSVDVMFESVARVARGRAMGVILTGMGKDGALGLKLIRDEGCLTIAQNKASCVVYGMPKAAVECGAVDQELPLKKIAQAIEEHLQNAKMCDS